MSNSTSITYQKATENDLPQILAILQTVKGDTSDIHVSDFLIAKDGEKVVGCVRIKVLPEGVFKLASLGVLDAYREQGIGRNLLKKLLESDSRRPIYVICIPERKAFYEHNGFVRIEVADLPQILREHVRGDDTILCMKCDGAV